MTHVRVAVIGGGFGGIGAAIQLKRAGIDDFVVFERAAQLGGTWRDNSYPGCACDVPSRLYSYSFAHNPDWSRSFSPQPEIWRYLRDCAERFGVTPHLRLSTDVRAAGWDDTRRLWRLDTGGGPVTADVLVSAAGPLHEPAVPDLPGLADFAGTAFHSSRWDHGHDLTGRRVAVVGTGASAVQFVPRIAATVGRLDVYQRTAPWIMPRNDRAFTGLERRLYRSVPPLERLARGVLYLGREAALLNFRHRAVSRLVRRISLRHLARQVPDPALRARLTPRYDLGCKRVLLSDDYLPVLARPDVELVTEAIREVRPHSVVTADGTERPADTIIFGTGFHVTDMPVAERIRGRDGRTLAETWRGSPQAHLGVTVAGFPNLFLLLGPNTGLGHTSVLLMVEAQIRYVVAALDHMRRNGIGAMSPRPAAQAAFVAEVDRRMRDTVWQAGGCTSWYLDATGRNSTLWPGSTWGYRRRLARLRAEEYETVPAALPVGVAS